MFANPNKSRFLKKLCLTNGNAILVFCFFLASCTSEKEKDMNLNSWSEFSKILRKHFFFVNSLFCQAIRLMRITRHFGMGVTTQLT